MYTLKLSYAERKAIDWIGDRYTHGDDLFKLLTADGVVQTEPAEWLDLTDIEFQIPEYIAWDIANLIQYSLLDCFSDTFARKLRDFALRVV